MTTKTTTDHVTERTASGLIQLIDLADCGIAGIAQVGGKAAMLGELIRAGFDVPSGLVVTCGTVDAIWSGQTTVQAVVLAIRDQIPADAGPFAVRSSGVDEDGPTSSYAGLFETRLGVETDGLAEAITACIASADAARVRWYRRTNRPAQLAVIIQQQVEADAAGVVFTADPVTGERGRLRVSAVTGLGDRLVSGAVTPDEWIVTDGRAVPVAITENACTHDEVTSIADLARRIEARLGGPQDIEWAATGRRLVVVQARPITALAGRVIVPIPLDATPPDGYWEREASHSPKPLSPMSKDVFYSGRNDGLREMFAAFGFLADGLEFRDIGGWDYMRLVPLGGKDRKAPPVFVLKLLLKLVPQMRQRIRVAEESRRTDAPMQAIEHWYDIWQGDSETRFVALRDVDLAELEDSELIGHIDSAQDLVDAGMRTHFLLHGAIGLVLADLAFTCRDLLGWSDAETFELVNGLSVRSTRPSHDLAGLADLARHRPAVMALLESVDVTTIARLRRADPDFSARLDSYLLDHGYRCLRYDIADPTLVEVPLLTVSLLSDQLARGYDPSAEIDDLARRRSTAASRARQALTDPVARAAFERVLSRAERAYPVREDNEYLTVSAPLGLLRLATVELGSRLALRGRIGEVDDVFFLTMTEAKGALADDCPDVSSIVIRRRGERLWADHHRGPAAYGNRPPEPPPLDVLPPAARAAMECLIWTVDRIFEADRSNRDATASGDPNEVAGIAASGGTYTGPVRIVMDELEFGKVRPGDVLVCPVTSPVWSVLFPSVGALVTDTGGLLSHPAIIAREYRIPGVVATANATRVLRDGQLVTVDGTTGRVDILT